MKIKRFFLNVIFVVACSIFIFTGCSSDNSEKKVQKTDESVTEITMFYPVNIGGSAANLIDDIVADFNTKNPDIFVTAVYTGNYNDTVSALKKAKRNNKMPELFISLAAQRYDLMAEDAVMPLDEFIKKDADGESYINDFIDSFMLDSRINGSVISIPFQRSTEIVYYNKDMFRRAGLNPDNPPQTWDELKNAAMALTSGGTHGVGLALNRSSVQWTFTGFALENSVDAKNLMSEDGKHVYFNTPENVEIINFWRDLQYTYKCMDSGIIQWTDLPVQFIEGKVAMIYHTTGNMENIRKNTDFDFGCFFMPGNKRMAAPTGGGNFYMSKGISEKKQAAAWKFIRFCTDTDRAAQWSLNTGYIPVRKSCFETEAIKKYYAEVPQAKVAYDQLTHAVCGPEISTYHLEEVWDILDQHIEEAMQGRITPEEALKKAQEDTDKILEDIK